MLLLTNVLHQGVACVTSGTTHCFIRTTSLGSSPTSAKRDVFLTTVNSHSPENIFRHLMSRSKTRKATAPSNRDSMSMYSYRQPWSCYVTTAASTLLAVLFSIQGLKVTFFTEALVQHLRLKKTKLHNPIQGINEVTATTKYSVSLHLKSRVSS
jgi:hypothetical protein